LIYLPAQTRELDEIDQMPASTPPFMPETRQRLLQAAIVAFGQRDYDGVSARQIVETAQANISAISYHFGGKHGLYLATVEYLAERLHAEMAEHHARVAQALESADREACADRLCDFIGAFVEVMLAGGLGESAPGIIFREQHQPTDAYEVLYRKLLQPIHATLTGLVACYRGETKETRASLLLAHALLGQAVIFRIGRTTLLKRLGKSTYSRADITELKRRLSSYCRCLLKAPQDPKDSP
jgi:AcrR family transcriptional regulator